MTTLKQLAPTLLRVVKEAQEVLENYTDSNESITELLEILCNEDLAKSIADYEECIKPSANPNEKIFPESSMVSKADYEPENSVLIITFKNGTKYAYQDFPADKWEELKSTESIGKYINSAIKGAYTSQKLETIKQTEL